MHGTGKRRWLAALVAAGLSGAGAGLASCADPPAGGNRPDTLPAPRPIRASDTLVAPPTLLGGPISPVDLCSALRLAGVANPEILLARERVVEAVALRQLAAAQILPNINVGTNFDNHTGNLQQSSGNILKVNRSALYLGLGANAVGAGTVTIPGITYNLNVSEAIFGGLVSRLVVREREFTSIAVRNDVLLRVALAYLELLRAEGHRAIAFRNRADAAEVFRLTTNFVKAGVGRQGDADRAATELARRNAEISQAEEGVLTASARLTQLLDLDPSTRLHATDGWVVPAPIVPDPIPLPELLAIALARRPELAERRTVIEEAFAGLRGARLLPFSPNILFGYSAGTFGGGSNLVAEGIPQANGTVLREPRFDRFDDRQDLDVVVFWTLRNLGVGNVALIRLAQSHVRTANLQLVEVLDRVRAEVAEAYARTHARFAQITSAEQAVRSGSRSFEEDMRRIRARQGLPIELMDSARLLTRSRYEYLDAIIDYNRAQFELYVALGQPPACCLARPIPAGLVPPPEPCPPPASAPAREGQQAPPPRRAPDKERSPR